jgi:hypothetical protein
VGEPPATDTGAEAQHAIRQLLVGDAHDSGAVIGIRDDEHAARPDDPRHLAQRLPGVREVLEGRVRPRAVEHVGGEGQRMRISLEAFARPRLRASSTIATELSRPTTSTPYRRASSMASAPVPVPISRWRRPGAGSRSSTTRPL